MDREKMIEEMIKDINEAVNGNIDLVEREYFSIEAKSKYRGMGININTVGIANALSDKGYRKIPDGAVVLTKEEAEKYQEYKRILAEAESARNAAFYRLGQKRRDEIRKETAREIFSWLRNREPELIDISGLSTDDEYLVSYTVSSGEIKQKAKEYGVKVEE